MAVATMFVFNLLPVLLFIIWSFLVSGCWTPVKTTMEHSRPAFRDLPRTGDAEPVDRGKIWLRTIEDDLRPLNFGLKTRDGKAARFI